MTLAMLFEGLCDLLSKDSPIEKNATAKLRRAKTEISPPQDPTSLPVLFLEVMNRDSAHPACHLISQLVFHWAPPKSLIGSELCLEESADLLTRMDQFPGTGVAGVTSF